MSFLTAAIDHDYYAPAAIDEGLHSALGCYRPDLRLDSKQHQVADSHPRALLVRRGAEGLKDEARLADAGQSHDAHDRPGSRNTLAQLEPQFIQTLIRNKGQALVLVPTRPEAPRAKRVGKTRLGLLEDPSRNRGTLVCPGGDLIRVPEVHLIIINLDARASNGGPNFFFSLGNLFVRVGVAAQHDVGTALLKHRRDSGLETSACRLNILCDLCGSHVGRLHLDLAQARRQERCSSRTTLPLDTSVLPTIRCRQVRRHVKVRERDLVGGRLRGQ